MIEIIPAVIPKDFDEIKEKFSKVLGLAKKVQIDIVDGDYAPNRTWPFNPGQNVTKLLFKDDFILEIDMLVRNPTKYIPDLIKAGARSFVIQIDSCPNLEECIDLVKSSGCFVGLGVKPSIGLDLAENLFSKLDFLEFMGNDKVGYSGVELDLSVLEKIREFRSHSDLPIQIDIGVNFDTASSLIQAGATGLVSGSAVFTGDDIEENIKRLQLIDTSL